jgi:hypothetical protein
MPRDGTETYVLPFPDVEEDTTIESTVYNGFTNDVAQDLNTPRPVKFGGTGADNPADAMQNLGGELAKYLVTNYDAHPFQAGSFYSTAGATSAPTGNAFIGICYVAVVAGVPTTDMFIEARDQLTGLLYVRQKKANVWQGWTVPAGFTPGTTPPAGAAPNSLWWDNTRGKLFFYYLDPSGAPAQWVEAVAVPDIDPNTFVEISGDVMTGFLTLNADPVNPMHAVTKAYIDSSTSGAQVVRYTPQTLTPNQQAQARANIDVTKKNYILNGAMMVSQEYPATAVGGSGNYPVDQFQWFHSNAATQISQQIGSQTPGGSVNRLRLTISAADASVAAGDYLQLRHLIEGYRMAGLKCGTAAAKTVTLQFGCKGPAGTYCVAFLNSGGNRYYVAEYTITAGETNTDVVKTITLTLDTVGTGWDTSTGVGLDIRFVFMAGATYQTATLNTWFTPGGAMLASANQFNFAGSTSNIFELFDVSLTEGSVAPPFVVPDYAEELALCQRYWQIIETATAFYAPAAGATHTYSFPFVNMRSTPAATLASAGTSLNASAFTVTPIIAKGARLALTAVSIGNSYVLDRYYHLNARL